MHGIDLYALLLFLLIGLVAGWIASRLVRGDGFGLVGNMIVGVVGAFVGSRLFHMAGIDAYGVIGDLVTAVVGAAVLLYVIRLVKSI